ncbi:FAD-binding domain-containing protein [Hypoxylon sp. FL1284]|nr:FAD-binding domain-containing protein [Hypoxylon sp. FL1284]
MGSRAVRWPANIAAYDPDSDRDGFVDATERWSGYGAPSFASAVRPKSEQEVAEVVKIATASDVPFLATGGRHGYTTTLGALRDGLAIDLGKLDEIRIDAAAETVTIGPGVMVGDLVGPVLEAGFQMPTGTCPEVSVIGVTIGGGIGFFQGMFGLMIDALLSVRVVVASGDVVEASASSNADLFWAVRGAGANFGIITSATYKLSKAVNGGQVFAADVVFPAGLRAGYFAALKTFEDAMPAELGLCTSIVWSEAADETQIVGTFVYSGPESRARELLAPFFELGPAATRASVVPWSKIPEVVLFGMLSVPIAPGRVHDQFTANVRRFSVETLNTAFEKYDAFYRAYPEGRGSACILETFPNQAVRAVSGDATAYPWRESKGNFMFQLNWPELGNPIETVANDLGREIRDAFFATSGFPEPAVYLNYAHGDEKIEQIYGGDKMPRLAALKKQWDPENVFKYNNALPTEYP